MENQIRRPASVWIAQIFMVVGALLFLLPLVLLLFIPGTFSFPVVGLAVIGAIYLGVVASYLAAFWGMARRRKYGRWLGVGLLSLLVLFSTVGQIARPSGPFNYYEYDNSTQAIAGYMTQLVILGLLIWLIVALAFDKRTTAFFSGRPTEPPQGILP